MARVVELGRRRDDIDRGEPPPLDRLGGAGDDVRLITGLDVDHACDVAGDGDRRVDDPEVAGLARLQIDVSANVYVDHLRACRTAEQRTAQAEPERNLCSPLVEGSCHAGLSRLQLQPQPPPLTEPPPIAPSRYSST